MIAIKPIRETLTVEDILKEQSYKNFDKVKMDALIKQMDIQNQLSEICVFQ